MMNKVLSLVLMTLMIGAAASGAGQTWTGEITSSNCELTHTPGLSARDCTRQCVEGGAAYVFVSDGKVYRFANQRDGQLYEHAGDTVVVSGELKGDTITVTRIEPAAKIQRR